MTRLVQLAALPGNQLTMLCRHVFAGDRPAGYVEPSAEGILLVSCGEGDHEDDPADWLPAGLEAVLARDPGLMECPAIPLGQAAERDADGVWTITDIAE
jgi:hypothetical protein